MALDQAIGTRKTAPSGSRPAFLARAAVFGGAALALGWALHWIFLPSKTGAWFGLYSTGKITAIALALLIGAILAWAGARTRQKTGPEWVAVLVAASLGLLLAELSQGIHLVEGTDLAVNLLAADGWLHGLKQFQHSSLTCLWGPDGPVFQEAVIAWYPPGPTWIFTAVCQLTGLSPLGAARLLWPILYLLNVALLARVLRHFAATSSWLDCPARRLLLAAALLWWIAGCSPAQLLTADMLALPLNLAVLLACYHLIQSDRSLARWALAGLAGGSIYLLKYSQFIDAAALLAVSAVWIFLRDPRLRRLPPMLLAFALLLGVPVVLTWSQGHRSAVQYTEKTTLPQSDYILDRYGDRFETASTPLFAALGVAGGLGWNSLGYAEWPQLPTYLAQRGPVNFLWDWLGWNRVCSWCLVLGLALTPLAWRNLRTRPALPGSGPAWLLLLASALAVVVLAGVGFHKGYQWNIGLEGYGRLLLPMSAVLAVLLVTASERRYALALLVAVMYVFGPAATFLDETFGATWTPLAANSTPALGQNPDDFARWTRLAQARHARTLIVLLDDLDPDRRVLARSGRILTFGSVLPICFVESPQLETFLQNPRPHPQLALLDTPSARAPALRQRLASHDIVLIEP
ncbi:MAG: hypothetical protein ABSH19_03495 [Opitutales bacterium]|jgi:hypothetical protein